MAHKSSTGAQSEMRVAAIDKGALARQLQSVTRGEVRFDDTSRALYASDGSNYRQVPIGVVLPHDADDVIAAMTVCRQFGAPVLPRGCGTSLCGQACNVAVVFDLSKYMNRIIEVDPDTKSAWVEPGLVLDDLREAAEAHQLTFAPDPSTHNHNTLGGMIGNNSCGPHSIMSGRTSDNVLELDVLTYDGTRLRVGPTSAAQLTAIVEKGGRPAEIYQALDQLRESEADVIRERYPDIPRRVSGFNLPDLLEENGFNLARALVGSEGTCCTVLKARVQLVDSPPARVLLALGYESIFCAADHIPLVMEHGPIAVEGVDDRLVHDMNSLGMSPESIAMLPDGQGWLMVEFGSDTQEDARAKAQALMDSLQQQQNRPSMKLISRPDRAEKLWTVRKSALGATAHVPHKDITWEGWEDSSVPPENLGGYLRALQKLYEEFGYRGDLYGHFGQGCVHTRINFDLKTAPGIATYKRFMEKATSLVLEYGGSLSGEHGDGQSKAQYLDKMYGERLTEAFRRFKSIWDPGWKMNPGKVVMPYRIDENLRLGPDYNPAPTKTWFRYADDQNNFARATLRCVGVGECRKHDSGTMCPSYMATREEKHSTRGRARLLYEMLQGDVIKGKWRNEGIRESLDLCLSCKGCLTECPVNVDMATYKAEFMAHHYRRRLRPRAAYAFGLINHWLRAASVAPRLVNYLGRARPSSTVLHWLANLAPQRRIPEVAQQPFTHWFFSRKPAGEAREGKQLALWPDTFSNYLHPASLIAATEVLESAGYQVKVPRDSLCCGRPLYEFGLLGLARRRIGRIVASLRQELREGTPIVVLEPSCASVFRHDITNLDMQDEDVNRLQKQTWLFSEFVCEFIGDGPWPALERAALVHGHCHHKAIMGMDSEMALLNALGVDAHLLDSGCCGMAGAFGFEKEKYPVSIDIGERVLLPEIRGADAETLIVANGYACREQIAQCTERRAVHIAEVLNMARTDRARD